MTVRSTVCPSSDVSPTVMVTVQTVADVTLSDTFRSSVVSRIVRKSELCIHVVNCTCIYKGVRWKYKIQPTERDWKQHDRHAVYVIAQQFSLTTCLSLRCRTARKLSACL